MAEGCYYTDDEIASMEAQHDSVCAENRRLKWLIGQVLGELPTKRDWLNPDVEREMRASVNGGSAT